MSDSGDQRYAQMDSLRGIAAVTVVLHHCLLVLPSFAAASGAVALAKSSPLHIAFAGREAVLLFFVLSGFVLALPCLNGRGGPYSAYLVKRVCRIWLPYIVAILAALMARLTFSGFESGQRLSDWYESIWAIPLTTGRFIAHATLIAPFDDRLLDPVVWSLTHEMRISLVFPLLFLVVTRLPWWISLSGGVFLSVLGSGMAIVGLLPSLGLTLHFVLMFVVGILLAQYRHAIVSAYQRRRSTVHIALLAAGVLAYTYQWWVLPDVRILHLGPTNDWVTTIGVTAFMVTALSSRRTAAALLAGPLLFLGRISYSLYLWHAIILIAALKGGLAYLPMPALLVGVVASSLVVAAAAQHFIERPSQALGRHLSDRVAGNRYSHAKAIVEVDRVPR